MEDGNIETFCKLSPLNDHYLIHPRIFQFFTTTCCVCRKFLEISTRSVGPLKFETLDTSQTQAGL